MYTIYKKKFMIFCGADVEIIIFNDDMYDTIIIILFYAVFALLNGLFAKLKYIPTT